MLNKLNKYLKKNMYVEFCIEAQTMLCTWPKISLGGPASVNELPMGTLCLTENIKTVVDFMSGFRNNDTLNILTSYILKHP